MEPPNPLKSETATPVTLCDSDVRNKDKRRADDKLMERASENDQLNYFAGSAEQICHLIIIVVATADRG